MTRNQLNDVLNEHFKKWKAVEEFGYGVVRVKVKGPICINTMGFLFCLPVAAGTTVLFETMGFWESLFTKSGTWKIKP